MTNRLSYPTYWASGGTATDPDLDTTAPTFIADRYEKHGWASEKPPEDWQNFLSQITDEKTIGIMLDGLPSYDASVTYQEGALYRKSDKFYRIEGGVEKEILSIRSAEYLSLIQDAKKLIDDHLAADNPHQDTVDTLVGGSYIKSYVDNTFGDPADPSTIVYHKLQTGGTVHGETPAQVGTLPAATGGTFTGDVIFLDDATIQVNPAKYIHYNHSTAIFEIVNGTYSLGVDAAGNGFLVGTSGLAVMISEANVDVYTIKYNNSFVLPIPMFRINMESDINDADSVGMWTIATASAPVFVADKGYDVSVAATLSGVDATTSHTLVVRGFTTNNEVAVVDKAAATYSTLSSILTASGKTFTHVKQIWIYPNLTARQKSKLVTS